MNAMSAISADALHTAVLAKLGAHEDPRTAKVLRECVVSIEHHVSDWEASSGRVVGHRVRIGLSAALLGALRGHPHVEDEVTRIVGVAVSDRPGEAASDVLFHHEPALNRRISTPYRGEAPVAQREPLDLSELASDYLAAFGEPGVAALAKGALIEAAPRVGRKGEPYQDVLLVFAPEDRGVYPTQVLVLESCLRDLLGSNIHIAR